MAFDPATNRVMIFGGIGGLTGVLGDTWAYDGTTVDAGIAGNAPAARAGSMMAFDASSKDLVPFGGSNGRDGICQ